MKVDNLTFNLTTLNAPINPRFQAAGYTMVKHNAIALPEIVLMVGIFIFLAYWYVRVTKNREQYTSWTNPNGRIINLYKKVRLIFWVYTVGMIILSIIQIILSSRIGV